MTVVEVLGKFCRLIEWQVDAVHWHGRLVLEF